LDLLNNNGTGKADTGSYTCSRYFLFGKALESYLQLSWTRSEFSNAYEVGF